jgi:hypothetical protein
MVAKYRSDTEAAVAAAAAARVPFILAGTPAPRDPTGWRVIDGMYREVAVAHPEIRYADGGVGIAPGGEFRASQQCLPSEVNLPEARPSCSSALGQIVVRSWDGAHFCQANSTYECPGYASGAFRYAINLVDAVRLFLDSRSLGGQPSP